MNVPEIELIKSIQRRVGVKDDGQIGPLTLAAIARALEPAVTSTTTNPVPTPALDPRTEANIASLEPAAANLARQFMELLAAHYITAKITSGRRSYDEQNALYEQGRTKPGRIVTNARGGYSNHNFGLAFDITIFDGATPEWESPKYRAAAKIGKSLGLLWGGDWGSDDQPHFELRPDWAASLSENDALAQYRLRQQEGRALV